MDRLEFVWKNILDTVRSSITEQTYATWFEPIRPVSITDFETTIENFIPSRIYTEKHIHFEKRCTSDKKIEEGCLIGGYR